MPNPFYNKLFNAAPRSTASSSAVNQEYAAIETAFDNVDLLKAPKASPTFTGTSTFSGPLVANAASTFSQSLLGSGANAVLGVAGTGAVAIQTTNISTAVTVTPATHTWQVVVSSGGGNLAVGAMASFQVNNSKILGASQNLVFAHIVSGAPANTFEAHVDEIGTGYCRVRVRNVSAAPATPGFVLNFLLVRGGPA